MKRPTEGIHLFSTLSYSYSAPSSVSRINLLSSLEKDMRGSLSKSEGDWGKPFTDPRSSGGFGEPSMVMTSKLV
jgi:hypothetical protein